MLFRWGVGNAHAPMLRNALFLLEIATIPAKSLRLATLDDERFSRNDRRSVCICDPESVFFYRQLELMDGLTPVRFSLEERAGTQLSNPVF